jgi:hypothetical protein
MDIDGAKKIDAEAGTPVPGTEDKSHRKRPYKPRPRRPRTEDVTKPINPAALYSEAFASAYVNVDRRTLSVWRKRGHIQALNLAGSTRCIRYRGSELLAFIERSSAKAS